MNVIDVLFVIICIAFIISWIVYLGALRKLETKSGIIIWLVNSFLGIVLNVLSALRKNFEDSEVQFVLAGIFVLVFIKALVDFFLLMKKNKKQKI